MEEALKEKETKLVARRRLVHLLISLNPDEIETLELLLDADANGNIRVSLEKLDQGKGIPLAQW